MGNRYAASITGVPGSLFKRLVPAPVATPPSVPPASGLSPAPAHPGHSAAPARCDITFVADSRRWPCTHERGRPVPRTLSRRIVVPHGTGRSHRLTVILGRLRARRRASSQRMQGSTAASRPNWYPCHATTLDLDAHVSRAAPDNNGSATSARAGHLLDAHVECLFFSVGAESASTPGEPSRLFGQRQRTPQSTSRLFSRRGPRRANSPLFVYLSRHDHCVHWARRRPRRPGRVHSPFARRGESARMPPALRQRQRIPQATNGLFPKRRQWRASPTSFLGLDVRLPVLIPMKTPPDPHFSISRTAQIRPTAPHTPWASPTLLSPNCAVPPEYGHPP
ncbi:hypothetical protein B0H14DRAFT_3526825 [Mycena olivaceomarginata]|nr:hypothetical protein B0H14DRAFT_3526825 [Mycena olivaceomarginata]